MKEEGSRLHPSTVGVPRVIHIACHIRKILLVGNFVTQIKYLLKDLMVEVALTLIDDFFSLDKEVGDDLIGIASFLDLQGFSIEGLFNELALCSGIH